MFFPVCYRMLILASLLLVFSTSLSGQTVMGKFAKLLWYEGTRLNDSTLVTKKGHQVNYSRKRGSINVKLNKANDPFAPYLSELDKTAQRKKDASRIISQKKQSPVTPAAAIIVNQELDRVYESAKDLRKTSVQLESIATPPQVNSKEPPPIPTLVKNYYQEVMAFIAKNQATENFNPPPPPSRDFDYCWECDSAKQQAYRQQETQFMDEYLGEEREMLRKLTAVWRYFGLRESGGQPLTVEEKTMEQNIARAMGSLLDRFKAKVKKAWTQYSDDAQKLPFLNGLVLSTSRQCQLLGYDDTDFITFSEVAAKMEQVAETFLSKAINEKDYKVILNIRWILGLLRQSELLNGSLSAKLDKSIADIAQLTKFKVIVEARAKVAGGDGVHQLGEMKGENYFCAVPDTNCVLQWILVEPDVKKMAYKLEEAEFVVPEHKPSYVGTRTWKTGPADIRLDFCNEEKDTALLFSFQPDNGQELWDMPEVGATPMGLMSGLFNECFMDVERVKKMAAQMNQEKMISEMMKKYEAKVQPNEALMKKDPSQLTPEEMKKMNEMMMASREISAMVQAPTPFSYLLKGRLKNRQKLVFEETLDAKKVFPQNKHIVYGTFTVKIEHAY